MPNGKNKRCSIRDLAGHLGVSICTVSRVLNGRSEKFKISAATRDAVLQAAEQLDYVPNVNAKRIFSGRSTLIGLLVPPRQSMDGKNVFADNHFAGMMDGIEDVLAQSDYHLLLLYNREEYRGTGRYRKLFSAGLIDGLMVWGIHRDDRYWTDLVELTSPRIFINTAPAEEAGSSFSCVVPDYFAAGEFASDQLLQKGCRRILYLMGKPEISPTDMAREGVARSLKKHGLSQCVIHAVPSGYEEADGMAAVQPFLPDWAFDGVLAASPGAARGAAEQLCETGQSVPVQIVSASRNDMLDPRRDLPVCIPDDYEVGRTAALSLLKLMEDGDGCAPIRKIVPCRIKTVSRPGRQRSGDPGRIEECVVPFPVPESRRQTEKSFPCIPQYKRFEKRKVKTHKKPFPCTR